MADLLNKIGEILPKELQSSVSTPKKSEIGDSFADILKNAINETNELQISAEKASTDIATGQVKDLHQAALAIDKAETSMKLMLEVRNKAVSAYKEILRTQM
ncbi:MAG: flagellar hook-basal body complex protein FliE [Campylobacterota bacterium]|nr:flagellar hook-basal body complex protein FliE [Campylobacterota bacterium]